MLHFACGGFFMPALARSYTFDEIEADLTLVEKATKECFVCDPDNPRALPRHSCTRCGGTGQEPIAAAEIAKELMENRRKPKSANIQDEEFLEY